MMGEADTKLLRGNNDDTDVSRMEVRTKTAAVHDKLRSSVF